MPQSSGKAGSLFFGMTLDTNEFKKQLKEARKLVGSVGKEIKAGFSTIATGATVVAGAVAAGSAAMLAFAKSTAEATNAQLLLADSIGATQSEIAGLEVAAERLGVETGMLFDKVREFGGVDAFKKYADQVKNAGDEQAQLNKAIEIFGGEGAKMVSVLAQGSAGLAAMEQEAISLGLALSPTKIAQTNVAWEQFEDTILRIRGLSTQLGTALMKPFGLASAAVEGFVATFSKDIMNSFTSVSDFMSEMIIKGVSVFETHGIPAINAFISFASQIGDAFATVFNFIQGSGIFGTLKDITEGFTIFLATFKQQFVSGISGAINTVLRGAFDGLARFSNFLGGLVIDIAAQLEAMGIEEEGFADAVGEAFGEQAAKIRGMGRDLAKPFVIAQEDAEKEITNILEDLADKNLRNQLSFKKFVTSFSNNFVNAVGRAEEARDQIVEQAVQMSRERAGMAITGSQEEFRTRSMQDDMQIDIARRNLKANEKIARNTSNKGSF